VIDFLWVWWDARNKANAGDKIMSTKEIFYKVQAMQSFYNLHTHEKANKKQSGISCWSPPAVDILKINFDGAYSQREKKGAWGFVVRDHRGAIVMAGAGRINVLHDALRAEAQACLAALYATIDQGISQILLETDSSILVASL
jgi:hypothetical protein